LKGQLLPSGQRLDIRIVAGLNAVVGDEGTGKSSVLQALAQASHSAAPLDHALPNDDALTPRQVLDTMAQAHVAWMPQLSDMLVEALALAPHMDKPLYMLSAGSRRKVGLVGLLSANTTLTLLDQPFAALDQRSINVLLEVLQEAAASSTRAWVIADYSAHPQLPWAQVIPLG
jgi:ABC-type transport system involved in cytochrome bd biosynthesis fused ATPase/permease subunit